MWNVLGIVLSSAALRIVEVILSPYRGVNVQQVKYASNLSLQRGKIL